MADMIFYEKPGCINGEKQKNILKEAGNQLTCKNILNQQWDRSRLMPFIKDKDPVKFMNSTAPAIKNGDITPEKIQFDEAVELMIQDPILIKRPLIIVEGNYIQGFDDEQLKSYLGKWKGTDDVITCPNLQTISCDDQKGIKI